MFIFVGISPVAVVIIGVLITIGMHVPVWTTVVLLMVTSGLSLIISLAICAFIAARMSPEIRREPEWTYTKNRVYLTEPPPSRPISPGQIPAGAIEPPCEVHNHLHIDGMDNEQLAAYLRDTYGSDNHG